MTDQPVFSNTSLIAPEGDTRWYESSGVLESVADLGHSLWKGEWLGVGADAVDVGVSALGAVMDPFQPIFAAGVSWLMEHLAILREPLDMLAGDPWEIQAHADSWHNVEKRIDETAQFYADEVNRSAAEWTAMAAAAYRGTARAHAEDVESLGRIADILAEVTRAVGAMVGIVRTTVKEIISEVVGAAISKALQAFLIVTIPKVMAEVSLLVYKCSARIIKLLQELATEVKAVCARLGPLAPLLGRLMETFSRRMAIRGHDAQILHAYRGGAATQVTQRSDLLPLYREAYDATSNADRVMYGGSVGHVQDPIDVLDHASTVAGEAARAADHEPDGGAER